MPTKIFTTISGPCPFGKNVTIDSPGCRSCEHFYRTGTGTFFWCKAGEPAPVPNMVAEILHQKPKRGRPRKTTPSVPKKTKPVAETEKTGTHKRKRGRPAKKAISKPVKTRKPKNG